MAIHWQGSVAISLITRVLRGCGAILRFIVLAVPPKSEIFTHENLDTGKEQPRMLLLDRAMDEDLRNNMGNATHEGAKWLFRYERYLPRLWISSCILIPTTV